MLERDFTSNNYTLLKSDYLWIQWILPRLIRWPISRETALLKREVKTKQVHFSLF